MNNMEVEKKKRKTLYGILFILVLTILATLIVLFLCPQMGKICIQDRIMILFYILIFVIITIILKMIKIEKIMKIYGWLSILAIFIWEAVLILFLCPQMGKICIQDDIMILLTYILILLTSELLLFALIPFNKELGVAKYIDFSNKGYLLYDQGEYRGASHCFRKALEYVDSFYEFVFALNRYDIYCALGNTLGNLGVEAEEKSGKGKGRKFFEEALEKYNVIVRKKQESDTEKEKKDDISIEKYEKVGEKQKGYYWQARYGRAHMFNDLERYDDAVKEFREVKRRIEELRGNADQKKDLEDLEKKININIEEAYCSLGNTLGKLADKKETESEGELLGEARDSYIKAISIRLKKESKDDYWEAHQGLANMLHKLNDPDGAKKEYNEVIKLMPGYAEAYHGMGNVLAELGKRSDKKEDAIEHYEDSADAYRRVIRLKDDFADAYYGLGNVMAELAKYENEEESITKYEEARNNYEKAIQYKFKFPDAYNGLGNVLKRLGKNKKEESNFVEAIKTYKKAIRAYRIAIKQKPDFDEAKNNLEIAKRELEELTTRNP